LGKLRNILTDFQKKLGISDLVDNSTSNAKFGYS